MDGKGKDSVRIRFAGLDELSKSDGRDLNGTSTGVQTRTGGKRRILSDRSGRLRRWREIRCRRQGTSSPIDGRIVKLEPRKTKSDVIGRR